MTLNKFVIIGQSNTGKSCLFDEIVEDRQLSHHAICSLIHLFCKRGIYPDHCAFLGGSPVFCIQNIQVCKNTASV